MKPPSDPILDHAGAVDWNKPPLERTAAETLLRLAELELANARLAGENDRLRAKCARLSATVDELLARLAARSPRAAAAPVAGHEPVCRYCGSADMRYRLADRGWRCHTCGTFAALPLIRRVAPEGGAPAFSRCACHVPRADTPEACPTHGALSPENA